MNRILWVALVFAGTGCGGLDESAKKGCADSSDCLPDHVCLADGQCSTPTQNDATPTECSEDGNGVQLLLKGAFARWATGLSVERNLYDRITAFKGTANTANDFWFGRDGDNSDGDLEIERLYEVSEYPYHIVYDECDAMEACSGFFALAGTYTVYAGSPVYKAAFELSALYEGGSEEPGAPMPGTVSGCIAIPNP